MFDGIEYRGFGQDIVEELAEYAGVPVWNGLTNEFHPTQMLADMLTIREHLGKLKGVKLVYMGDARYNMGNSLMVTCAKLGMHFVACTSKNYFPEKELVDYCEEVAKQTGGGVTLTEDVAKRNQRCRRNLYRCLGIHGRAGRSLGRAYPRTDAISGERKGNGKCKKKTARYSCIVSRHSTTLRQRSEKKFMKKFGISEMEVTDEVFESPQSVVFDEAENRMHTIKAVMLATLGE